MPAHTKPNAPMMMKAISQPIAFANNGIVAGAANAPTDAPALKIAVAKARSFFGKYSAVTLIAAGKLPASPSPKIKRQARNNHTLTIETVAISSELASNARRAPTESNSGINQVVAIAQPACITAPNDHTMMAIRYPFFVPIQSMNLPANKQKMA